jgi:flagellar FliL protein
MADNEEGGRRRSTGRRREGAAAAEEGKLKLIIAAAALLAMLGGGGAGLVLPLPARRRRKTPKRRSAAKPPAFVDVPDMLVNLVGAPGERVQYLKVKVVLEVKEEKQVEAIKPTMPRVTDIFQTYLRELRPSDLNGSAGLLSPEGRTDPARQRRGRAEPVNAVLFKEIVVQ